MTVEALIEIVKFSKPDDNVIELILKNNPIDPKEPTDDFFNVFLEILLRTIRKDCPKHLPKLVETVFKNEEDPRQEKLYKELLSLQDYELARCIEHIPEKIIASNLKDYRLLTIAKEVVKIPKEEKPEEALQNIAKIIEVFFKNKKIDFYYLLNIENLDMTSNLLHFFSQDMQLALLGEILVKISQKFKKMSPLKLFDPLLKEMENLDWRVASAKVHLALFEGLIELLPDKLAAVVNGQAYNSIFLKDFFLEYFGDNQIERQIACVEKLEASVFNFDKPSSIRASTWTQFFRVIRECPKNAHTKEIFLAGASLLFNDINMETLELLHDEIIEKKIMPNEQSLSDPQFEELLKRLGPEKANKLKSAREIRLGLVKALKD